MALMIFMVIKIIDNIAVRAGARCYTTMRGERWEMAVTIS